MTGEAMSPEPPTGVATGVGSMPGEDFREAMRMVLGVLPDLPYMPELPARSEAASMTGRSVAMLAELGADLQPAGWRLTDAPGRDQRRARSLLAQDLDAVEELTQDYAGAFKAQVAGPLTLAATVERPRGDRLLADHGARRELAQSLVEAIAPNGRAELYAEFALPLPVTSFCAVMGIEIDDRDQFSGLTR